MATDLGNYKKSKRAAAFNTHRRISKGRYRELHQQFPCFRCSDHRNSTCPAADKECKSYHKVGHYSTVCFKTLSNKSKTSRHHSKSRKTQSNMQCSAIELQMLCGKGSSQLTITPDSGSEMTSIGLYHLKQLGMNVTHLLPPSLANLQTAHHWSLFAAFMLNHGTTTHQMKHLSMLLYLGIIPIHRTQLAV